MARTRCSSASHEKDTEKNCLRHSYQECGLQIHVFCQGQGIILVIFDGQKIRRKICSTVDVREKKLRFKHLFHLMDLQNFIGIKSVEAFKPPPHLPSGGGKCCQLLKNRFMCSFSCTMCTFMKRKSLGIKYFLYNVQGGILFAGEYCLQMNIVSHLLADTHTFLPFVHMRIYRTFSELIFYILSTQKSFPHILSWKTF